MNSNKLNTIIGWIVFLISLITYSITVAPTVSFWDCGEFIAASMKMQVAHSPGAPLFILIGNFFSKFAFGDLSKVALMVNMVSVISSAFTIFFLHHTIVLLLKKIKNSNPLAISVAAAIGAISFAFTDTFWFSAVEAEVYAMSSLMTAIVFWAMLKWDNDSGKASADKWLLLIAFVIGLSIGVHLLNLLAIPSLCFIYYFKKREVSLKGIAITAGISVLLLFVVQFVIIQYLIKGAAQFELFAVNTVGLPFNSGVIIYSIIVLGLIGYFLLKSYREKRANLHHGLLAFCLILLGYSTYSMVVIRSQANPAIDINNPENIFNLISYLDREQYGDRPLLKGKNYNAQAIGLEEGREVIRKVDGEWKVVGRKLEAKYKDEDQTIFPRMYSSSAKHIRGYKTYADIKGDKDPTLGDNIAFFRAYQLNWMYWRYFFWNFVGRQNDQQGYSDNFQGNWISGIEFVDEARLGPQDQLTEIMKNDRTRNVYFFLPLILGILGMVFHFLKAKKDAWVVLMLFLLTGVAIVIYLNQTPFQPRERDYAYVGSFYAFAIWLGVGAYAIMHWFGRGKKWAPALGMLAIPVPGILLAENFDDHDRSQNYIARDLAYNTLISLPPDAIFFTNGDNATYPVWYLQEVENVRTDVRVVNLSLLGTEWYLEQQKLVTTGNPPLPISLEREQYFDEVKEMIRYKDGKVSGYTPLKDVIEFIKSDNPKTKINVPAYGMQDFYPTKNVSISIDTALLKEKNLVTAEESKRLVSEVNFKIPRGILRKSDLVVLDIIANNDGSRPICFSLMIGESNLYGLKSHMELRGLTYQFKPLKGNESKISWGYVNDDFLFDLLINKFKWGNLNAGGMVPPQALSIQGNVRTIAYLFGRKLLSQGDKEKCLALLYKFDEEMPKEFFPYNDELAKFVDLYLKAGAAQKGVALANEIMFNTSQEFEFLAKHGRITRANNKKRMQELVIAQGQVIQALKNNNEQDTAAIYAKDLARMQKIVKSL